MKMDRNIPENAGAGKYAIVNLRRLRELCPGGTFDQFTPGVTEALKVLSDTGALEWGRTGEPDEFFLIKLKDKHARPALSAYGNSIFLKDEEFAEEVFELASRSGVYSPFCKDPD